eukprot:scaffold141555_cov27-Tisochrysis_lutea.AAC.3
MSVEAMKAATKMSMGLMASAHRRNGKIDWRQPSFKRRTDSEWDPASAAMAAVRPSDHRPVRQQAALAPGLSGLTLLAVASG